MTSQHGEEIKRITIHRISLPLAHPFQTSFGRETTKHTYIVEIETKSGEVGYGETVAGAFPGYSYETVDIDVKILEDFIIPSLDSSVSTPEEFLRRVSWIKGYNMAKASIEMALWDLNAKLEGKPLYKFIGGVRDRVSCGVSIGIQTSTAKLIKRIEAFLEEGYQRIKVKIKRGLEKEILSAIRKEFPDILLTADANGDYLGKDIEILVELDKYNLLYLEQPFPYWSLILHAKLAEKMDTKICLDETITNRYTAEEAIAIGAAEVINIKPGRVGGFVESLAIHNLSSENNVPVWIGGMLETGIGRGFNVALATLPNVKYPSDISASRRYFKKDIVTEPWEINRRGEMEVRKEPGIGVEIDWPYLESIRMWRKEYRL